MSSMSLQIVLIYAEHVHVLSELTIEPFVEGEPGPHVTQAIAVLRRAGFEPEVGPFATSIRGPVVAVQQAIEAATVAAFSKGATAVSVHNSLAQALPTSDTPVDLVAAIGPILDELGAELLPAGQGGPADLPLIWDGEVVAMVRAEKRSTAVAPLHEAVPRLISQLEDEFGASLAEMDREQKQRAARWLEERGAFQLRNSVDLVADAMKVSRVTVYTYLAAMRQSK